MSSYYDRFEREWLFETPLSTSTSVPPPIPGSVWPLPQLVGNPFINIDSQPASVYTVEIGRAHV